MNRRLAGALWTIGILLALCVAFALGFAFRGGEPSEAPTDKKEASAEEEQMWTCSMHPGVRLPEPGLCPICNMELVEVEGAQTSAPVFETSESAKKLMEIETSPVQRKRVTHRVRLVGRVDYDETRLTDITAWVGGRIDRLFVDFTGITVREGDHMVYLYSPDILSAQEELIQARRAVGSMSGSDMQVMRESTRATLEAARDRLRLWGLTEEQIADIEQSETPSDHITIYAPEGGIVIHKHAREGAYVDTGSPVYTVADLRSVWVRMEAYESDLPWIRYGQRVTFTAEALPGEEFVGRIAFIAPFLDPKTRTVSVRVNVPNPELKLKPDMLVDAEIHSQLAATGAVMNPDYSGKWICPMHPSVIKDAAGDCDVCGMPLVEPESLGYRVVSPEKTGEPLVIPASAPLITGRRAIVYVELPGRDSPTWEGREVVLGPQAGDYYIVRSGLEEGDEVVTQGNFKIDSALQIQAKPSMMSAEKHRHRESGRRLEDPDSPQLMPTRPAASRAVAGEVTDAFREDLTALFDAYIALQEALASDEAGRSATAALTLQNALDQVDMTKIAAAAHMQWMELLRALRPAVRATAEAESITARRAAFQEIVDPLYEAIERFGLAGPVTVYRLHCPMADENRGADWLQTHRKVRNPYYGSEMLTCGHVTNAIEPGPESGEAAQ